MAKGGYDSLGRSNDPAKLKVVHPCFSATPGLTVEEFVSRTDTDVFSVKAVLGPRSELLGLLVSMSRTGDYGRNKQEQMARFVKLVWPLFDIPDKSLRKSAAEFVNDEIARRSAPEKRLGAFVVKIDIRDDTRAVTQVTVVPAEPLHRPATP